MKNLLLLLLLIPFVPLAQDTIPSNNVGLDDSPILTKEELVYTYALFEARNRALTNDLANKKIGFSKGNYGATPLSKSSFFNIYCKPRTEVGGSPGLQIIFLTAEEAEATGFDVLIIAWSKIPADGKARKKFVANAKKLG